MSKVITFPPYAEALLSEAFRRRELTITKMLPSIITDFRGDPDWCAIGIYVEIRDQFIENPQVIRDGYWIAPYKYWVEEYKTSRVTIRKKFTLLENLGLMTRKVRMGQANGHKPGGSLCFIVWRQTPYFYSEIGVERKEEFIGGNQ